MARTRWLLLFALAACGDPTHAANQPAVAAPLASAASAPAPAPAPPPTPKPAAPDLSKRADACLDDPSCPAGEADRLFRAADDAGQDVDCLRFADGDGTTKDLARARACLARSVAAMKCDGSSAGLWQTELAFFLIDGVGGPVDVPGARAIFDGCFDDGTKHEALTHAEAREKDAATPAVDFCKDLGGTTITINECMARDRQHERTRGALEAKRAVAALDDEGRRLFDAATHAYATYVDAMGSYIYEVYKDGTIRNARALGVETELTARRTKAIAQLASFAPAAVAPGALRRSSDAVVAALKKRTASVATPEVAAKVAEAQRAWLTYRDAEVALYARACASRAASDAVARAVGVALNDARVADLKIE